MVLGCRFSLVKVSTSGHRAPQNQHRTKQEARVARSGAGRERASPRHPSGRVNNGTEASRQAVFPQSRAPRRLSPSPRRKKIRFPHPRRLAISTSLIPRPSPHFFLLVRPSTAAPLPLPHAHARSPPRPRSLEGWKKSSADGRRERGLLGEEKKRKPRRLSVSGNSRRASRRRPSARGAGGRAPKPPRASAARQLPPG